MSNSSSFSAPSVYEPLELFTLTRNQSSFNESNNRKSTEEDSNQTTNEEEKNIILSVLWKNNKIGAAYYNTNDLQIYVLKDMFDVDSQFLATKFLYGELKPVHVITTGSNADKFVKCLIDTMTSNEEATVTSNTARVIPPDLSLLSIKEYSYEACKTAIMTELILPTLPATATLEEKEVFLHSHINFDNKLCMFALGLLLKFLSKYWSRFAKDDEELRFMDVNQVSLKDHVYVDDNSYEALQIFKVRSHEATFKHGTHSSNREGLSIFKMFSSQCKSQLGQISLRNILMRPLKNVAEINKRLEFIEFALQPMNKPIIDSIQDDIRKIYDLNLGLSKIQHSRSKLRDWQNLYTTMCNIIHIHETCAPYQDSVTLFSELDELITPEVYGLLVSINNAIDFSNNRGGMRPTIKFGLDDRLDAKKLKGQEIGERVSAAANFVINRLPSYVNECGVIYIPEMGHLITIKEWEPNCDRNALQSLDFEFMFELHGTLHYKGPVCIELNNHLGDIHNEIIAHENRIIERLAGFVLKHNRNIRVPLQIIALLDCLIAMSNIAEKNNYVRPQLNQNNTIQIKEGRHALLEVVSTSYQSNSYYSEPDRGRVKIITGPNASGKTVYTKQVGMIVFLAHIGSYVPATRANICMMHSMHTRMHTTESTIVKLSSFMLDLSQVTQALNTATSTSMVIIDEFGRGTLEDEGMGLLLGILKKLMSTTCPHILVSTHFEEIYKHLPETPLIEYLKMDHASEGGNLTFLYKAVAGIAYSCALDIAEASGLDANVVARARHILHCLKNNIPITPCSENIPRKFRGLNPDAPGFSGTVKVPEPDD